MVASSPKRKQSTRERRQLTVMFCDLVNSTGLQQIVDDDEDYTDMVEDFFECCREYIEEYGGEVQRYEGDGLLAYFGFPKADELATQSAVRAALKIASAVPRIRVSGGITLETRIGIATGVVIVGQTRDHGKAGEHAAQGAAPPLAARLLKLAEPGGIVVSGTTHGMVSSLFDFDSLGERRLAGIAKPQPAWLVTGDLEVESHSEAIHLADELTPLVGRESELSFLLARWQDVQNSKGQAVLISGEAGVGKSRTVRTLLERLGEESLTLLHLYGVQYFQHSALYPIAKQLERDARIRQDDDSKTRHRKLEKMIGRSSDEINRFMPWFSNLLSLPPPEGFPATSLSPERQHQELVNALVDRILAMSEKQPVLMIFEDLHWFDGASLALIETLIQAIEDKPVLLLLTHRSSFEPHFDDCAHLSEKRLGKLSRDDRKKLVMEVTGQRQLPPAVLEHILEKTDGNPLYVEEFTKSVLDSKLLIEKDGGYELQGSLKSLNLPNSLRDSLMSRLDRLSDEPDIARQYKEIAQTCAAVGRHFSYELVAAVSPYGDDELQSALYHLEDAELVFRLRSSFNKKYSFKHALVQEEAYRSILNRNRKRLHVRIAEVLERQFPGTRENEPELLAHHYTEGDAPADAIPYWLLAGAQAGQRAAHVQAVAHLESSLQLIPELPEGPTRDSFELKTQALRGLSLAASRGYGVPEVQEAYERARTLCDCLEDEHDEDFSVLQSGLVTFYIVRGQYAAAIELSEQFVQSAEQAQQNHSASEPAVANYHIDSFRCLGISRLFTLDLEGSRVALERCAELFERSRSQQLSFVTPENPAVAALSVLPLTYWLLGRPDEAVIRKEQALELAHELKHPFNIAFVHGWSTVLHQWRREPEKSIEHAQAAIRISDDHGFDIWSLVGNVHLSIALGSMGKMESALEIFGKVRPYLEATGMVCFTSYFMSGLAETYRIANQPEVALEYIAVGMQIADSLNEHFFHAELYRQRGMIQLSQHGVDNRDVEADLRRAADMAKNQHARSLQLRALISLHQLHRQQGREAESFNELKDAYGGFTEGFETADLLDAKALLNE